MKIKKRYKNYKKGGSNRCHQGNISSPKWPPTPKKSWSYFDLNSKGGVQNGKQ